MAAVVLIPNPPLPSFVNIDRICVNPKAELRAFIEQDVRQADQLLSRVGQADESILGYVLALRETPQAAMEWLTRPAPYLGNKTPLELSTHAKGIAQVKEFLVRIEYDMLPPRGGGRA